MPVNSDACHALPLPLLAAPPPSSLQVTLFFLHCYCPGGSLFMLALSGPWYLYYYYAGPEATFIQLGFREKCLVMIDRVMVYH